MIVKLERKEQKSLSLYYTLVMLTCSGVAKIFLILTVCTFPTNMIEMGEFVLMNDVKEYSSFHL